MTCLLAQILLDRAGRHRRESAMSAFIRFFDIAVVALIFTALT